jgi:hypothetical protein
MPQNFVSPAHVAAELRAREHRASHDFPGAARAAQEAAEIARAEGDLVGWWSMTFFQGENLLDSGDFDECAQLASTLVYDSPQTVTPRLQARARILLSKAWQATGLLENAADEARAAALLAADDDDAETHVEARQALVAALGERGRLGEAWTECLVLADVISDELDDQLAGKAYWVIGNVAFLCDKVEEGLYYHERAAATFSPARNLAVWAKFNTASAAMRLAAEVADAATLRCIERAELATDVIGGSENDLLLLKLNRAHWSYLVGEPGPAVALLEEIRTTGERASPQILGEACLLLGRAYLSTGDKAAARQPLREASGHFESAGAPQRAEQARDLLAAEA